MLVMGTVADVVDVGTFSEGDGERAGFDECKERQATRGLIPMHTINGCLCIEAMLHAPVKRAAVNECSRLRREAQATMGWARERVSYRWDGERETKIHAW